METTIETVDVADKPGLLGKKPDDMTVGDSLIIMGVATAVCVAVPLACIGVIAAGQSLWTKAQEVKAKRRRQKLSNVHSMN